MLTRKPTTLIPLALALATGPMMAKTAWAGETTGSRDPQHPCYRIVNQALNAELLVKMLGADSAKDRVLAINEFDWNGASPVQRERVLKRVQALRVDGPSRMTSNSYEIGAYLRLAQRAGDATWQPVLEEWLRRWSPQVQTLSWQRYHHIEAETALYRATSALSKLRSIDLYAHFANLEKTLSWVRRLAGEGRMSFTVNAQMQLAIGKVSEADVIHDLLTASGKLVIFGYMSKFNNFVFRWDSPDARIVFAFRYPGSPIEKLEVLAVYWIPESERETTSPSSPTGE
ncbi:MAG TPA: hypothetical protein VM901_01430 [Bdellovibrionota bacterium]|jgi:hypothetical protein|nr:hypothetical protein [Bdellovibrionota bacterium]